MRTGRHGDAIRLHQEGFELANHMRPQHMLDLIGIAIDVAGGNVGVGDQIKLPHPMITHHADGFGISRGGQTDFEAVFFEIE